jgi:hypothetical protein
MTMIHSLIEGCESCPATQALERHDDLLRMPEFLKHNIKASVCFIKKPERKRRKCDIELDDLLDGMKTIEDSIAFPSIEWVFDDAEASVEWKDASKSCSNLDDFDENQFPLSLHRLYSSTSSFGRKRSRHGGMVRSNFKTFSLSSLVSEQAERDFPDAFNTNVLSLFSLSGGATVDESLATMAVNEALSISA